MLKELLADLGPIIKQVKSAKEKLDEHEMEVSDQSSLADNCPSAVAYNSDDLEELLELMVIVVYKVDDAVEALEAIQDQATHLYREVPV